MSFRQRLQRLLSRPLPEIRQRVSAFARRKAVAAGTAARDRFLPTFAAEADIPAAPLQRLIPPVDAEAVARLENAVLLHAERACRHEFDLLGSGPVVVHPGLAVNGLEGHRFPPQQPRPINRANRAIAQALRQQLSAAYQPIDWQLDLRSGYRWREDQPSSDAIVGARPGIDIKLPWELARMQHLPGLALAYAQWLHLDNCVEAERVRVEFQDQVLDFIAANPPRFGVNWVCTMDVALRIVSWLVAFDLFRSAGAQFAPRFESAFKRTVVDHGRHIVGHLEWFPHLRSNHYLANMTGLLFVAAYLPEGHESNAWLVLAANELAKEISSQFNPDGSNFEGSTCYHRLSGEMALYSIALARSLRQRLERLDLASTLDGFKAWGAGSLPKERNRPATRSLLDPATLEHLAKIGAFAAAVTRPDGTVAQIGDNDSGRCLILSPRPDMREDDHQPLIAGIAAACGVGVDDRYLESLFVRTWTGDSGQVVAMRAAGRLSAFPDFGLYIFRRPRLWLSVRCGSVGQNGNGGHAHNDQLSIELCLGGLPFVADPGTYVYTPLPDQRNAFRATASHATLVAAPGEQNQWIEGRDGLFSMSRVASARVIAVDEDCIVGEHDGFYLPHRRAIFVEDSAVRVIDECRVDNAFLMLPLAPGVHISRVGMTACMLERNGVTAEFQVDSGHLEICETHYSPAYGKKIETRCVKVRSISTRCQWRISMVEVANG